MLFDGVGPLAPCSELRFVLRIGMQKLGRSRGWPTRVRSEDRLVQPFARPHDRLLRLLERLAQLPHGNACCMRLLALVCELGSKLPQPAAVKSSQTVRAVARYAAERSEMVFACASGPLGYALMRGNSISALVRAEITGGTAWQHAFSTSAVRLSLNFCR